MHIAWGHFYGSFNSFAQEAKRCGAEVSNYAVFAVENVLCLGAFWISDFGIREPLSVLAELLFGGGDSAGCVSGDPFH